MNLIQIQERMPEKKFYYLGLTLEQADDIKQAKYLTYFDEVIAIGVDEEVPELAEYLVTSKF